jgi:hypothetical protein
MDILLRYSSINESHISRQIYSEYKILAFDVDELCDMRGAII